MSWIQQLTVDWNGQRQGISNDCLARWVMMPSSFCMQTLGAWWLLHDHQSWLNQLSFVAEELATAATLVSSQTSPAAILVSSWWCWVSVEWMTASFTAFFVWLWHITLLFEAPEFSLLFPLLNSLAILVINRWVPVRISNCHFRKFSTFLRDSCEVRGDLLVHQACLRRRKKRTTTMVSTALGCISFLY